MNFELGSSRTMHESVIRAASETERSAPPIDSIRWYEREANRFGVPIERIAREFEIASQALVAAQDIPTPADLATMHEIITPYSQPWLKYFNRDSKDIVLSTIAIGIYTRDSATHFNMNCRLPLIVSSGGAESLRGEVSEAMLTYRKLIDPTDKRTTSAYIKKPEWRYESQLRGLAKSQQVRDEMHQRLTDLAAKIRLDRDTYDMEAYGHLYDQYLASNIASNALASLGFEDLETDNYEALFAQLDWEILPAGSDLREIIKTDVELAQLDKQYIDVNRLSLLESLATTEGLSVGLYRSKMGLRPEPYYAAVIEIDGTKVVIGESPVLANATYIVREDLAPGTWQEVLSLKKADARDLSAERVIHPDEDDPSKYLIHRQNVMTRLELMLKIKLET